MGLFRKKRSMEPKGRLTDYVAAYLETRQRKLANWLNAKTEGISKNTIRKGLVLFCLIFGGYLIYMLISAIY